MSEHIIQVVDTQLGIVSLLQDLESLPTSPPSLYVDLEGVNLCRYGTISLLQLYVLPKSKVYIIDIHNLGGTAFDTESQGITLRSILECPDVPKALFDCRNDSDALYAHYKVDLKGIIDVQLLEVASRTHSKNRLTGLANLILRDCVMTNEQMRAAYDIKSKGRDLFAPECGGSYEVFNKRPLEKAIIEYCAQDVTCLPELWSVYTTRIADLEEYAEEWADAAAEETLKRIAESQSDGYSPYGSGKSWSPWVTWVCVDNGDDDW